MEVPLAVYTCGDSLPIYIVIVLVGELIWSTSPVVQPLYAIGDCHLKFSVTFKIDACKNHI